MQSSFLAPSVSIFLLLHLMLEDTHFGISADDKTNII